MYVKKQSHGGWGTNAHTHKVTGTKTHTHPVDVWRYPRGMFRAGVTVQRGLACLRVARLESGREGGRRGGTMPSGPVCMRACVCVSGPSQRQVRVYDGEPWGDEKVINFR